MVLPIKDTVSVPAPCVLPSCASIVPCPVEMDIAFMNERANDDTPPRVVVPPKRHDEEIRSSANEGFSGIQDVAILDRAANILNVGVVLDYRKVAIAIAKRIAEVRECRRAIFGIDR